ncbi:MAG: DUF4342 domain-containing protein [Firmicutes bacterium]|nr:DUF4342 domain-containing protein [Bacillota bacterium]
MTLSELEKIDQLRQRLGIGYREAKEALDQSQGDVVAALVLIEERKRRGEQDPPVWGRIRTLVHKGNTTRIQLKKGDRTLLQVPATVGALGVVGAVAFPALAVVGAAGMVAALASKCSLEVESPEDGDSRCIDHDNDGDDD